MTDNILSAVLTFSLLAAGTAAIGSEMVSSRHAAPQRASAVVTLPTVTVVGHRQAAEPKVVTLPTVTVVGHRQAVPDIVTLPTVVVTGHRLAPEAPASAVTVEALADAPTRL